MLNNDFKYEVAGAPVTYTELKPTPYNPLKRPEISYRKPVFALLIYSVISSLIMIIFCASVNNAKIGLLITALWSVAFFLIIGKRAIIWMVHLYQNKASDGVRLRCVFEPCCSEYMILALEKYGLFKGLYKGISRLFRCHLPNGGVDYP